jgi:hypothetical protein
MNKRFNANYKFIHGIATEIVHSKHVFWHLTHIYTKLYLTYNLISSIYKILFISSLGIESCNTFYFIYFS